MVTCLTIMGMTIFSFQLLKPMLQDVSFCSSVGEQPHTMSLTVLTASRKLKQFSSSVTALAAAGMIDEGDYSPKILLGLSGLPELF